MKYPIAFILRDHKAQDNFACRFDFMISQKTSKTPRVHVLRLKFRFLEVLGSFLEVWLGQFPK